MSDAPITTGEAMAKATKLVASGNAEEAKRIYQEILSLNPQHKKARKALRALQRADGKQRLGEEDFSRVASLMRSGKMDAARTEVLRLCKLYPREPALHNLRGIALSRGGHKAEALSAFGEALALEPAFAEAANNLASTLVDLQRFSDALKYYRELVNRGQADAQVYFNLARALRGAGQLENAAEALRRALKMKPLYPDAHNSLGNILNELGRHGEAVECYESALELDPKHRLALANLAHSLSGMQRFVPALELFQQLHALEPENTRTLRGMARALQRLGQLSAAAERFEQILAIDPKDALARHQLASLRGEALVSASPDYVRALFEPLAATFDEQARKEHQYQVPEQIVEQLETLDGEDAWYPRALDLGCGTGLAGAQLRGYCEHLTGLDLSPAMLKRAEEKAVYDRLEVAELVRFLDRVDEPFDLVVAADVLVYLGHLEQIFTGVAGVLAPGGRFVFSTELLASDDYRLQGSGRFAHSESYIARCAGSAGLEIAQRIEVNARKEQGALIPGSIHVLSAST